MLLASIPAKFNIPFANSAGAGFIRPIPEASQIGIQAGAASLTDGFPPDTFLPIGAGGTPPWGEDVNGILKQLSEWARWQAAGGAIIYDATFQAAIGGYPKGTIVQSLATFGIGWLSTIDANTTNPDAAGAGWAPISYLGGTFTTGSWTWRPTSEVLAGFIKANATTIGDATSGASQLADPTAYPLFAWHWTNFSDSQCPVSTGRGANPAADFAAHKTIQVLDLRGIGIKGMDTMGGGATTRLNGVPATFGSGTTPGSLLGENLHTLLLAELAAHAHGNVDTGHIHLTTEPTHTHSYNDFEFNSTTGNVAGLTASGYVFTTATGRVTGPATTGLTINNHTAGITVSSAGSDAAHNTVDLSMVGTHYLHL